jgi:hypothetical protein
MKNPHGQNAHGNLAGLNLMANCSQCKYSDETVKNVLTCWHIKHSLSKCSKNDHDCQEFEVEQIDEPSDLEW